MEVHTHTHTPRKKWHHYFWEFFMLFLAVTLGFLVENKREHYVETKREKQYIRSLFEDLKENDTTISRQLIVQRNRVDMMDSMINMLNNPSTIHGHEGLLYYFARKSPRLQVLAINSRTFDQLKNSGNFRLISDLETSNRIMAYYETLPLIRQIEGLFFEEFNQYKIIASQIFDPAVFSSMEMKDGEIIRSDKNPTLRSYDANLISQLSVFSVYMNGSGRGVLQFVEKLKANGEEMIAYLQKEYHLE